MDTDLASVWPQYSQLMVPSTVRTKPGAEQAGHSGSFTSSPRGHIHVPDYSTLRSQCYFIWSELITREC
jgi:hypothetical protein